MDEEVAMCHRATVRLSCRPMSVGDARRFVVDQLSAWGVDSSDSAYSRVEDVRLVTSELVGNAVKFCADEVELSVSSHRDHIEVAVTDDSTEPAVLQHPGPEVAKGRGLLLVDAIAEQWGQRQHGANKTVWARIALGPGSVLAHGCRLPYS